MSARTRRSLLFQARRPEALENRDMPSGHGWFGGLAHGFAATAASHAVAHVSGMFAETNRSAFQQTILTAALTDSTGDVTGTVTYQTGTVCDGSTVAKLTVSVSGAAADSSFDVTIGDVVVGQITTDDNGNGTLVLSSNPKNTNDQSMPADFPTITADVTTVTIGTLSGTFTAATANSSGGGCSSAQGTRLGAALTDSSGSATGTVSYITYTMNGVTKTKFKVSVFGATADDSLDVVLTIDGETFNVGSVTIDSSGNGTLILSSDPQNSTEQALPANLPTNIASGTAVTVGTLSGTLSDSSASSLRLARYR